MNEKETGNRSVGLMEREEGTSSASESRVTAPPAETAEPPREAAPASPASSNGNAQQKTEDSSRPARPWLKPIGLTLLVIALIAGSLWGLRYWRFAQSHVSTDDAYLTTDVVQVTPQVAGNISKVLVEDNQVVKAGQLLVTLDDSTYRAAVDQAKANLAVTEASAKGAASNVGLTTQTGNAQIEQASGGVAQAVSAIGSAQADVERARATILNAQAGTQSARATVRSMLASVEAAIATRKRAAEAVTGAQAQLATSRAAVKSAQANVASVQATLDKAVKDQARYAELFQQDAVSAQTVDAATAAAQSASAQLDSAKQQVVQAQAVVSQRQSDVAAAQEQVRAADAAIAQARAQLSAAQQAVLGSQATQQQAQAQLSSAQQAVGQAEAKRIQALGQLSQAKTAPTQVSVSRANQLTAQAKILDAQAALETAEINLKRTRIYASVDGVISKKAAEVGQQVAVGQQIMAVIPNNDVWVIANYKETQMKSVRPGLPAEVEVDSLPGYKFKGHVDSIAAATGATFALLPPDNATGNFTKVVQRVPVKIVFEPNQRGLDRLRGGLSVVATIETK